MNKQQAAIDGINFELVRYTGGNVDLIVRLPNRGVGDILTKPMQDWVAEVIKAAKRPMPTGGTPKLQGPTEVAASN